MVTVILSLILFVSTMQFAITAEPGLKLVIAGSFLFLARRA